MYILFWDQFTCMLFPISLKLLEPGFSSNFCERKHCPLNWCYNSKRIYEKKQHVKSQLESSIQKELQLFFLLQSSSPLRFLLHSFWSLIFRLHLCIFKSVQSFSKALWQFIRKFIKLFICFDPEIELLEDNLRETRHQKCPDISYGTKHNLKTR